jgi:hypothetical protein
MMHHRCLHHPVREAAARCPECRSYFCRECVTEHEGRVICTPCLRRLTRPVAVRKANFGPFLRCLNWGIGFCLTLVCFYALGQILLRTPSSFHEGTLWRKAILDESVNP